MSLKTFLCNFEDQSCLLCGELLHPPLVRQLMDRGVSHGREEALLCPSCQFELPWTDPLLWEVTRSGDVIASIFSYEEPIRESLLRLKFHGDSAQARFLGRAAAIGLEELNYHPAAVVPLPLGKRRLAERGYNQAALIARELADSLDVPCVENLLLRRRETRPQTETQDCEERRRNVAGAFGLEEIEAWKLLRERPILLVDDVRTTGSSLGEGLRVLRQNGFQARAISLAHERIPAPNGGAPGGELHMPLPMR